jgi:hypothetical protein
MYPWEHAAVAYLLYAGYARWRTGAPPGGWAVLVVLVASQLPDLIDKPLAWQVGLLPSGRSLAHSVFVAVPLVVMIVVLVRRYEQRPLGIAFAVGYFSHLVTDAVSVTGSVSPASVLWPLATYESSRETTGAGGGADGAGEPGGVLGQTADIFLDAYPSLVALEPTGADLISLGIVVLAGFIWLYDGRPGVRELGCLGRRTIAAVWS